MALDVGILGSAIHRVYRVMIASAVEHARLVVKGGLCHALQLLKSAKVCNITFKVWYAKVHLHEILYPLLAWLLLLRQDDDTFSREFATCHFGNVSLAIDGTDTELLAVTVQNISYVTRRYHYSKISFNLFSANSAPPLLT